MTHTEELIASTAVVNAECDALHEHIRAMLIASDVQQAPANLHALGIPEAELRWLAACDYLREMKRDHIAKVNRILVLFYASEIAEENMRMRGDEVPGVTLRDFYAALPRIAKAYGPKAAAYVAERFIPKDLGERHFVGNG